MFVKIIIVILLFYIFFSNHFMRCIVQYEDCNTKHLYFKEIFSYEKTGLEKLFNPSIQKYGDKYICCIRNSTNTLKNLFGKMYSKYVCKTNIIFLEADKQFKKLRFITPKSEDCIEDPRLVLHNNLYYISCTEYKNCKITPVLFVYNKNYEYVKKMYYTGYPYKGIHKNWCPIIHENKRLMHTDTYPVWRVFSIDENANLESIITFKSKSFFKIPKKTFLRCSTSWKIYDEYTYICGLHTKKKDNKEIRTILVLIDRKTLLPLKYTCIFCIDNITHNKIQFLSGLEVDENHNVILTYGIGDYKITFYKISKRRLDSLFK